MSELKRTLAQQAHLDPLLDHLPTPSSHAAGVEHEQRWKLLLESDPDLASVAAILERFGPRYVDQLARTYTVFNRKDFLPIILEMIVSAARQYTASSKAAAQPSAQAGSFDDRAPGAAAEPLSDLRPLSSLLPACTDDAAERDAASFYEQAEAHSGYEPAIDVVPRAIPAIDFDDQDGLKKLFDGLASLEDDRGSFAKLRERADGKSSIPKD
ncbi:hypothetical protein [Bradyrhizobium centrolobii]|nr:hypothetical protein [Bradyrhizobium centrolobii]